MATHTPGPWRTVGGRTAADTNIETCDEFPRLIAVIRGSGRADLAKRESANARLIAAAPDLLAALRELTRAWDATSFPVGDQMEAALQAADDAITRAGAAEVSR